MSAEVEQLTLEQAVIAGRVWEVTSDDWDPDVIARHLTASGIRHLDSLKDDAAIALALAERLCPSWHHFGSGSMMAGPDGKVISRHKDYGPCNEHRAMARVALRAIADVAS